VVRRLIGSGQYLGDARWQRLVLVAATCAVTGCDRSQDQERYFADLSRPRIAAPGPPLTVTKVREFGAADPGPDVLWFGFIAGADVRHDGGVLAVADLSTCSIALVDLSTQAFSRAGRCGSGPGEFSDMIGEISFHRDTIIAADDRRRDLTLYGPDGRFVRTVRPAANEEGGWISDVRQVSESTFAAVFRRAPGVDNTLSSGRYRNLLLISWRTGKTLARALVPPPLADSALLHRAPLVTAPNICTSPHAEAPTVVVSNRWSDQVVFLSTPELSTVANIVSPVTWRPLTERANRPGERRPPQGIPQLACGTDYVVVAKVTRDQSVTSRLGILPTGPVPPEPVVRARWDFYSYDGQLRYTLEDTLPRLGPDSILVTTPRALVGDRLFVSSNDLRGHPVVVEYQLGLDRPNSREAHR
jgi:hypothetical protein